MSSESLLLIRPKPIPGESLSGYIVRLAKANGYPSTYWITQLDGLQLDPRLPTDRVISILHRLCGYPKRMLWNMTLHRFSTILNPSTRNGRQLDHVAVQRYVHHKGRGTRFCVACAAAGEPWRLVWQLRLVTTCLVHGLMLRETCPSCRRPLDAYTWWTRACRCGTKFREMPTIPVPQDSSGYRSQAAILRALEGHIESQDLTSVEWFATVDLLQRWFSTFPAGSLHLDGLPNERTAPLCAKLWEPIERDHVHYGLAVQAVQKGRDGFTEWCEYRLQIGAADRNFASGYLRYFGKLKELLRNYPELPHVQDWFNTYLDSEWTESYIKRVYPVVHSGERLIGLEQAAKRLHCRGWAIAYLIESGNLRGHLKPMDLTGRLGGVVEEDSVQEHIVRRRESLGLHQAAALLTVAPDDLMEMYYRGRVMAERGPITDGTQSVRFHPSRLQEVLRADCATMSVRCSSDSQGLPVSQVEPELGVHKELLPLLDAHGLLRVIGDHIEGWKTFRDRYLWEHQAARYVGLPLPSFRTWVSWGRFQPIIRIGASGLYDRADLERWTPLNRCTTKQATRLLGLEHPQQFTRSFVLTGRIRPIGGPGVDQGRITLFSRQEVGSLVQDEGQARRTDNSISFVTADVESDLLTTEEAACLLGLTVGAFERRYRSTDILIPVRHAVGSSRNYFRRSEVLRLTEGDRNRRGWGG